MEQELHITRKKNWFDKDPQLNITLEEWAACVKNDPDMRLDNFTEIKLKNGEIYRYENPGAAVWVAWRQSAGKTARFDYRSGNITVVNPDEATIEKMQHIAFKLGAKVLNEEGVFCEAPETAKIPEPRQPDFVTEPAQNTFLKKWWKRWQSVFVSAERR